MPRISNAKNFHEGKPAIKVSLDWRYRAAPIPHTTKAGAYGRKTSEV